MAQAHQMTQDFLSLHLAHLFQEAPSFRLLHSSLVFLIRLLALVNLDFLLVRLHPCHLWIPGFREIQEDLTFL